MWWSTETISQSSVRTYLKGMKLIINHSHNDLLHSLVEELNRSFGVVYSVYLELPPPVLLFPLPPGSLRHSHSVGCWDSQEKGNSLVINHFRLPSISNIHEAETGDLEER